MIYLDNAATTFPKPECVYEAMDKMNRHGAVNAGRGSYKLAQEASRLISDTKQSIRRIIHANFDADVVFTSSVTIAMNQIANGLSVRDNAVVYVSPYEHNAVARTVHHLSKIKGWKIKEIPIDPQTLEIDLEKMKYEFSKDNPEIVFCTHVSNVTGYILPVAQIFEEAKRYKSITILDTAQSLGLIEVRVDLIDVDIIAFAGHKSLYGPFGIGGFVNVSHVPLDVFITGGTGSDSLNLEMPEGSEAKYEAASRNIVAIAGLNAAIGVLNQQSILEHETKLTVYLLKRLHEVTGVEISAEYAADKQVGIVSFTFSGYRSDELGTILNEDFNIAVRTGYHCAPFIHEYLRDKEKLGTVRVGIGQFTEKEDVDKLIDALHELSEEV